jgi:hypothetical protein
VQAQPLMSLLIGELTRKTYRRKNAFSQQNWRELNLIHPRCRSVAVEARSLLGMTMCSRGVEAPQSFRDRYRESCSSQGIIAVVHSALPFARFRNDDVLSFTGRKITTHRLAGLHQSDVDPERKRDAAPPRLGAFPALSRHFSFAHTVSFGTMMESTSSICPSKTQVLGREGF